MPSPPAPAVGTSARVDTEAASVAAAAEAATAVVAMEVSTPAAAIKGAGVATVVAAGICLEVVSNRAATDLTEVVETISRPLSARTSIMVRS
jgi:hypothetical protein